ncbi:C-type lectin domain family 12 member B isoform X4 [Oreochromis niloticus]|uniref:C-type lectin domain family 12 member B isoform X4 n=1 Tax=Oreochromis niloticus TaxID=8128 RepID=UPI000DF457F1|nr:C-type lectin domain family 12 member B isoform X4 [Oreochromis niloticus]
MSTEIQSVEDFRVKYSRGSQEDGGVREQSEVEVLDDGEQHPDVGLQEADALNKSQLQDELQDTKTNLTQLQSSYDKLSKNHSQLQEEVKKLKEKIEEKCPEGWRRFGSSCYFKSTERKTWSESRRDCQDKGADLVMINSKEEQEFVNEFGGFFWIGLRAKQTSGGSKWEWVDGSALTQTFWAEGLQYPISDHHVVYCVYDRKCYQYSSSTRMTFMCEK